jgi:hypothetical protein
MIESARNEKGENKPGNARGSFILNTIRQPIEAPVDATLEVLLDTKPQLNREPVLRLIPAQLVECTSAHLAAAVGPDHAPACEQPISLSGRRNDRGGEGQSMYTYTIMMQIQSANASSACAKRMAAPRTIGRIKVMSLLASFPIRRQQHSHELFAGHTLRRN